jgi:alpha-galactosidase
MNRKTTFFLLSMAIGLNSLAQKTIEIATKNNVLILETDRDNTLLSTYLGKKLDDASEYPGIQALDKYKPGSDDLLNKREAYIASGSLNLLEPALTVTHADGNKSTVLTFSDVKTEQLDQNRKLTSIILKDLKYNFQVTLKLSNGPKLNIKKRAQLCSTNMLRQILP